MVEEVYEIRIKNVSELSPEAQREVAQKMSQKDETFNFKGYAKVVYTKNSPLSIQSVDPIEGTIIDYFKELNTTLGL